MKKSQSLGLNTMVIAAIVIIVLVVTIAIFSGYVNKRVVPFFDKQSDCGAQPTPGTCEARSDCEIKGGTSIEGLDCSKTGKICCIISK